MGRHSIPRVPTSVKTLLARTAVTATVLSAAFVAGAGGPTDAGQTPQSSPRTVTVSSTARPGPNNTGVPAGTTLRRKYGDWTISKPGVYSGLDVRGFVRITASNVTIRKSIIRGGIAHGDIGLVNAIYRTHNVVIEDSELVPAHPSPYIDGVTGAGYTLRRVDIHGTVDGAKVFGNNTMITHSWIHGLAHFASDPNQGGHASHNDNVQVLGGLNVRIVWNTLTGASNAALQVTQTRGAVAYMSFARNWAGQGACTVNLQDKPRRSMSHIAVSVNRFAKNSTYGCAIIAFTGVSFAHAGNVWTDGTAPVTVVRRAG